MLVLSRKIGEKILIGEAIVLTVLHVKGGTVRLGVEAPADVAIARQELLLNLAAAVESRPRAAS